MFMIIKACTSLLLFFKDVVKVSVYLVILTEIILLVYFIWYRRSKSVSIWSTRSQLYYERR